MERHRPKGEQAITEFDRLFETGYRALVTAVVEASTGPEQSSRRQTPSWSKLCNRLPSRCCDCGSNTVDRYVCQQSRNWRSLTGSNRWSNSSSAYGHDLFTQKFLNLGSLRAILDQGAENYCNCSKSRGTRRR